MRVLRRAVAAVGLSVLSVAGSLAVVAPPAYAVGATFYVATTGNDNATCGTAVAPCRSLAYTYVSRAGVSDTINVRPGTYALTTTLGAATANGTNRLNLTKSVTIQKDPDVAGAVVLDGGDIAVTNSPLLAVNGAGVSVTLRNLTLQRGNGGFGSPVSGSALFLLAGSATLENVTFSANRSPAGYGGAVYVNAGTTLSLTGGAFTGNSATNGGAVFVAGKAGATPAGSVTATGTTFSGNTALGAAVAGAGNGGAIFNAGTLSVTNGAFPGNSVTQSTNAAARRGYGGAIFNGPFDAEDAPVATISGTTFGTGTLPLTPSATSGGAIANVAALAPTPAAGTTPGSLSLAGSSISATSAYFGGGLANAGSATITGGSISGNRAVVFPAVVLTGSGGGIYNTGTLGLTGTAVSGNTAQSDGGTQATGLGGGVLSTTPGSLTLTDAALTGNVTAPASAPAATTGTLANLGGGLFNGSTATVSGGTISGNTATGGAPANTGLGGGIYNQASLTVDGTTVADNTASGGTGATTGRGGGIFNGAVTSASIAVSNATITGNTAAAGGTSSGLGGGVYNEATTASVVDSTVDGNDAVGSGAASTGLGGGIYHQSGTLTLTGSSVDGNTAAGGSAATSGLGGGLINLIGTAVVTNTSLSGNTATGAVGVATSGNGGGINNFFGVVDLTGGTLEGNEASTGGGGIATSGPLTVDGGSLVNDNQAVAGGGLSITAGAATIADSAVTGNRAASAAGILNGGTLNATDLTLDDNTATAIANATGLGGGLYNTGLSSLLRGSLSDNTAAGGSFAVAGLGGGAFNVGTLTLDQARVSGNAATGNVNVQGGWGGGIYNGSSAANTAAVLDVDQSTLDANAAGVGSAVISFAPGASSSAKAAIRRSTVSGNSGGAGALFASTGASQSLVESTVTGNATGLVQNGTASTTVAGSILAGNGASSCVTASPASVVDGGSNLRTASDASCGFSAASTVVGDPQLGPLTANGGPTPTHLPGPGSAALDRITPATASPAVDAVTGQAVVLCAVPDQRGTARPQGARCDIGAVEAAQGAPDLSGPTSGTFTVGSAGSLGGFVATGSPTPTLSASGLPSGLSLQSTGPGAGSIVGTPAEGTGGTHVVTVTATNEAGTDTLEVTLTVNQAPTVSGPTTIHLIETLPGSGSYTTTGFPTPVVSVTGSLPSGVTFTPGPGGTGTISGTPAAGTAGNYAVTVVADNGTDPDATLAVTVEVVPRLTITTTSLPSGNVGVVYGAGVTAIGGTSPYTFSLAGGTLPAGLSLAPNGAITGTPTGTPGTSTFTVRVVDSTDPDQQADEQELSITIGKGPTVLTVKPVILRHLNLLGISIGTVAADLQGGLPRAPIAGQTVVFKAGALPLCSGVTDAQGHVSCTVTLTNLLITVLNLGVTGTYAGNATWEPASGRAGLLSPGL